MFGVTFDRLVRRALGPPPVVDPATLPLTGYWEQGRGTSTNFDPVGSPLWPGVASAGASGGRGMNVTATGGWTSPAIGAAVGGTNSVRFDPASDDLTTTLTVGSFFSVSALTIAMLVKLDATVGAFASGSIAGQCLAYVNGYMAIRAGSVGGGLGKVAFYTESPTVGTYIESGTFALGSWVLIIARYDGTFMKLRVAGVDATPVAAANISTGWAASPVRTSHGAFGTSVHDELSRVYLSSAWTDADCNNYRDYLNSRFALGVS